MLSPQDVVRELGIPRSTLYRLVAQNVIPTHPMPQKPWHRRQVQGFLMSEVRAALGIPEPSESPAARTG
ncbi:MAG TPA: helix-turn-helix domain-containing protein [Hyphomicrobiaceae bacterium]|nr:helix-turn-helix domain-containing protein [Hyphomicrobiaceae bacterium]